MFARERSQIICIFCHNLLALLLQMFAEFYLGISSIRNARNNLVAGETVLALLWLAVQSEDKLLAVGTDDGLGRKGDARLAARSYLAAYVHSKESKCSIRPLLQKIKKQSLFLIHQLRLRRSPTVPIWMNGSFPLSLILATTTTIIKPLRFSRAFFKKTTAF